MPAPTDLYWSQPLPVEAEAAHPVVPLSHYLWLLRRHRWRILAFVAFSVIATLIISKRLKPIYESTATLDIDRRIPAAIIGQESNQTATYDADQFLATQVKLVQSDSVLRPVMNKFNLQNEAEKERTTGAEVTPADRAEEPVILKNLRVARPPTTYLLLVSYRSEQPRLAADVANAIAQSYIQHTYNNRFKSSASLAAFMEQQLDGLRAKMERSGGALVEFERELNVINPEEKTNILSARLLQLNTEYTNAEADRIRKEAAFQSVKTDSLEAAHVSSQGDSLKKISERLQDAKQKLANVRTHFGATHPEFKKAAAQVSEIESQLAQTKLDIGQRIEIEYKQAARGEAMFRQTVDETKAQYDKLNSRSFEYQSLKREAEADKKLYEELVRKIREAGINAGFQSSSIRIADLARPTSKAVFPNIKLNLVLAAFLSVLLAMCAAVTSDALNNTVRQPEEVAQSMDTQVMGTLPATKSQRPQLLSARSNGRNIVPITREASLSSFDEAIRTLRNAILLTDFDRRLRSIMVTSAGPAEGKSTIASHLATAHAQQGRKTLLIDADLRRPSVHHNFGIEPKLGLSNVLAGEVGWRESVVRHEQVPFLDLLLGGPASRRAADQIGAGLMDVVDEASKDYDLIIVDSPPFLGFPEPLQMASIVDGVLVIAVSGQTNRRALASTVSSLKRLRTNLLGVVLNRMEEDSGSGYYHNYYYPKNYTYHQAGAAD
ncbi:MAG TPA: polysaccharide biosynthesis tyrosine autokinase [Bryobacteraceae bacterium]|nr:polysaccharide biosynthesis tyrosine autokinase [Bryobacteraceae bacterium]